MYTEPAEPRGARVSIFGPLKRSKTFFLTWMNFYPIRFFFTFCCACVMLWISLLWNKLFSHSQKRFPDYLFILKMLELLVQKEPEGRTKAQVDPISPRICHMIYYYQDDKKYPSLPRGNKVNVYRSGGTGRMQLLGPEIEAKPFSLVKWIFWQLFPKIFFTFCRACVMLWISLLWNKLYSHSLKSFPVNLFTYICDMLYTLGFIFSLHSHPKV